MRAAITFLIAAAIALLVAWGVSLLPGTVTATLGTLTLETSTPVAVLLAAVAFLLLYTLFRLIGATLRSPRRLRFWRARRNRERGDTAVTRALVALAAGDAASARREAARARANLGDQPITLLLAASASRLAGHDGEADATFQALAAQPGASFLGLRGLLRQAIARGDFDAAAELARRAEAAQPGAAWLRTERLHLALRTQSWDDALRLAPPDQRAAIATAAADSTPDRNQALRLAKAAWEADPALAPAALAYARRLRDSGKERAAQDVLRRTWAASPYPELAELALAPVTDPLARMRAGQAFVQAAPHRPESHFLLARLALEAGLTGEARRHLDESGLHQRRAAVLRADLAEAEGDPDAAREALRAAASAEPDPEWRCRACGTVQPAWSPVCPGCGTAASLAWVVPSAAALGPRLIEVQEIEALP